jgi:ribosomal protein S18 acetylase RimI-like enzyme
MDHVEGVAREAGVNLVRLQVWENNAGALGFYRSLGYESRERVMWKRV